MWKAKRDVCLPLLGYIWGDESHVFILTPLRSCYNFGSCCVRALTEQRYYYVPTYPTLSKLRYQQLTNSKNFHSANIFVSSPRTFIHPASRYISTSERHASLEKFNDVNVEDETRRHEHTYPSYHRSCSSSSPSASLTANSNIYFRHVVQGLRDWMFVHDGRCGVRLVRGSG